MSTLPSKRTAAEDRIAAEVETAQAEYDRALSCLSPKQVAFVEAYLGPGGGPGGGHWRDAAEAAGFERIGQELQRLRRNPKVLAAIDAGARLRSADAPPINKERLLQLLTGMLYATEEDFLIRNASGDPIGVRELASMPPGKRAAFKSLRAKVRRSAKGERAHVTDLAIEVVDPIRTAELIARILGIVKTGPSAVAAVQQIFRRPSAHTDVGADEAAEYYQMKDALPATEGENP